MSEESIAVALKLIPAEKLGQPYTSPADVKIGAFTHRLATGETFRVLCNCSTAQPADHTQRYVGGRYMEHRYPTEEEIRAALAPQVVPSP